MLTNFFGKSKPINFLVISFIFLSLYILAFFNEKIVFNWFTVPLFLAVFGIVNFINIKNRLTFDNSYAFLFFVLLIGFFPKIINFNSTFYANFSLLFFLRKVFSLNSSKKLFPKLFDAGFWLGISFLLEPFSLIFLILLYISIFMYQHSTPQALIIPFLGFFSPVFLFFSYCFYTDTTHYFLELFNWRVNYNFEEYKEIRYLYTITLIVFFVTVSILFKTPKVLRVNNTFKPRWILTLLNFAFTIIIFAVTKSKSSSELIYLLFPVAVILANGFELIQKKWLANTILISLFISVVASILA